MAWIPLTVFSDRRALALAEEGADFHLSSRHIEESHFSHLLLSKNSILRGMVERGEGEVLSKQPRGIKGPIEISTKDSLD